MSKLLSLAGFLALTFTATAHADPVYAFDYGNWHLRGYADAVNPNDNACVLSTQWSDGRTIQVNVFPKYDGSTNVTMTLLNPYWNNSGWAINDSFSVGFDFRSSQYVSASLVGRAQIYSNQKVIFRGMNALFTNYFVHYDTMTLFGGTGQQLIVSLDGTAALIGDLNSCLATVLGTAGGGNH
ncbi:MAG: hypothetical protein ACXVA9_02000 [Bdellovibrionales bacterium]